MAVAAAQSKLIGVIGDEVSIYPAICTPIIIFVGK